MFYSVQEIAETLRVSEATVLRLIRDEELRAVRVGRQYRIHETALQHLQESGLVPTGGEYGNH